ncbi:hypothetical protein D9M70_302440 [compost metagenome]
MLIAWIIRRHWQFIADCHTQDLRPGFGRWRFFQFGDTASLLVVLQITMLNQLSLRRFWDRGKAHGLFGSQRLEKMIGQLVDNSRETLGAGM